MANWTIVIVPDAMRALYQIPRDRVARVTAAIEDLRQVPIPFSATPIGDQGDTYRIVVAGHIVEYELDRDNQWVVLLFIS